MPHLAAEMGIFKTRSQKCKILIHTIIDRVIIAECSASPPAQSGSLAQARAIRLS
jgi:hypothetical protein